MENENIRESDLAEEVISSIVDKLLKKYKIDHDMAEQIVMDTMEKHPRFFQLLARETTA